MSERPKEGQQYVPSAAPLPERPTSAPPLPPVASGAGAGHDGASLAPKIQILLWWLSVPRQQGAPRPPDEIARAAAQELAAFAAHHTGDPIMARPDQVRQAIDHVAAVFNRWALGQEQMQWRVVHLAKPTPDAQEFWDVFSMCKTEAEAREDLAEAIAEGVWVQPHIQHRQVWETDWEDDKP
jgi:hypothetical protein